MSASATYCTRFARLQLRKPTAAARRVRQRCITTNCTEKPMPGQVAKCVTYGGEGGPANSKIQPLLIGVAGGTASGKTSVCKAVIEALKDHLSDHQCIISMSMDCYYKNLPPDFQGDVFSDYNFDHPSAFDFEAMLQSLRCLKQGLPAELPHYDYTSCSRLAETTHIEHANVILFDGILAFYDPEVRSLFDIKIFVDADADTRLVRRIRRDIVSRGRDIKQILDQYERTVKPSFESYIAPTKKHADIIIPRGMENTVALDLLLQHVKLKLRKQAAMAGQPVLQSPAKPMVSVQQS